MEETVYAILTDTDARDAESIEQRLSQELTVGAPWFD